MWKGNVIVKLYNIYYNEEIYNNVFRLVIVKGVNVLLIFILI